MPTHPASPKLRRTGLAPELLRELARALEARDRALRLRQVPPPAQGPHARRPLPPRPVPQALPARRRRRPQAVLRAAAGRVRRVSTRTLVCEVRPPGLHARRSRTS